MSTTIHTKEDLLRSLRAHSGEFCALGVKRIGLFGSFARGEADEDSDVDVIVEFCPGCKSFDNFIRTAFLLEDLLDRRVELLTRESLSPYIAPHVLCEVEYVDLPC